MGEQSNALRILLRNDRKSRHRRIKKQRRYERLAATSQFLGTIQIAPGILLLALKRTGRLGAGWARIPTAPSRVGVGCTLRRF